jgi:hypothetical protein
VVALGDDLPSLATGRYAAWRASDGVPVRSTVSAPRSWPHVVELEFAAELAPYGVFGRTELSDDEAKALYVARLDQHAHRVVSALAEIARRHPGETLVLLCFEDVDSGQACHRRWFAEWFEGRLGIVVPEVTSPSGA